MSQQLWNKILIPHMILGKNRALGSTVCIYTYTSGVPSVSELSCHHMAQVAIRAEVAPI